MGFFSRPSAPYPAPPPPGPAAQIPVELWQRILALACADGGRTACAVSLVSRYMLEVCADVRYACVRLRGAAQVVAFERCVLTKRKSIRVRHLFISTKVDEQSAGMDFTRKDPKYLKNRAAQMAKAQKPGTSAAIRILAALSPHLEHLALHVWGRHESFSGLLPDSLPKLEELELLGTRGGLLNLPALKRLHLASGIDEDGMELMSRAEHLTHIRVSGLYWSIPRTLDHALAAFTSPASSSEKSNGKCIPPTIELILLQPDAVEFDGGFCGTGQVAHREMMDELEAYASNDRRIFLLHAPSSVGDAALDKLEEHFLHRCAEGPGCWDLNPSLVKDIPPGRRTMKTILASMCKGFQELV